jgi:hypothetical protein
MEVDATLKIRQKLQETKAMEDNESSPCTSDSHPRQDNDIKSVHPCSYDPHSAKTYNGYQGGDR